MEIKEAISDIDKLIQGFVKQGQIPQLHEHLMSSYVCPKLLRVNLVCISYLVYPIA